MAKNNARKQQAAELAQKDGAAKLEQLKKGADAGIKWSAPKTVSRRDAQGLPPEVLRQVVSADASREHDARAHRVDERHERVPPRSPARSRTE